MNYQVSVDKTFSAAHALRGYKGKCERMHGHTWKVRVTLSGKKLDTLGMLMDFTEIKSVLSRIIDRLDHVVLNEVAPFTKINPTAELIGKHILIEFRSKIKNKNAKVSAVTVWESETTSATVSG